MKLNLFYMKYSVLLLFLSVLLDFELMMFFINLINIHLINGFKSIIFDYMHIDKLNFFLYTLMSMFLMKLLLQIMEMLF